MTTTSNFLDFACEKLSKIGITCYNHNVIIVNQASSSSVAIKTTMGVLRQPQLRGFVPLIQHHYKTEQLLNKWSLPPVISLVTFWGEVMIAKYNDVPRKLCLTLSPKCIPIISLKYRISFTPFCSS